MLRLKLGWSLSVVVLHIVCAESLNWTHSCTTRLPWSSESHTAVFDGVGAVYVIGGQNETHFQDIVLRYTLKPGVTEPTAQLHFIGQSLRVVSGAAVVDDDHLLYFGGYLPGDEYSSAIYRIPIAAPANWSLINRLIRPQTGCALAWDSFNRVAYLFGGYSGRRSYSDQVLRYDADNNRLHVVARMPGGGRTSAAALFHPPTNAIFLFGGFANVSWRNEILRYTPSGLVTTLDVVLPYGLEYPCAALLNGGAYIFGGDNLIYFSLTTHRVQLLAEGIRREQSLLRYACVAIPAVHRMFVLGGRSKTAGGVSDEIFSIELHDPAADAPAINFTVIKSKLPRPRRLTEAVYDGRESIYLIGGGSVGRYDDEVLRYSVRSGVVDLFGHFVPITFGAAVWTDGDEILYLGGQPKARSGFYVYATATHNWTLVATLPTPMEGMALVWDPDTKVAYAFGGYAGPGLFSDLILRYNGTSRELDEFGRLPEPRYESAAVWDAERRVALIFGGHGARVTSSRDILQFDPESRTVSTLRQRHSRLPLVKAKYICTALARGPGQVYLVGGNRLLQFNLSSQEVRALVVKGMPEMDMAACAYVDKLQRLYTFGGGQQFNKAEYRDDISYMDLSDLHTVTSTTLRPKLEQ